MESDKRTERKGKDWKRDNKKDSKETYEDGMKQVARRKVMK